MDDRRGGWRSPALAGVLAGVLGLAVAAGGGCQPAARVNAEGARMYPEGVLQARTLDVQVFRSGTKIELTNTSAERIESGVMWLNRWYSLPIEALEPGESRELSLRRFTDRYNEPYRAGGFFATRDPDVLVLAQVETGGEMIGLVVVENRIR